LVILRLFNLARLLTRRDAELQLNQEKDELLAISSHQLRTPLTTIQMYAEALGTAKDPAQVAKYVAVIDQSNKRMIQIVNTLVYTSELDMGEVQFKKEPISIAQIVQESLADNDVLLSDKHVTVNQIIPTDLPALFGDTAAVVAVVSGVLVNAVMYGVDTDPVITITARLNQAADRATLMLADNGHGIPEDDQKKLFTKLFRGSNARTLAPDGSGLSLYLARTVLSRMDGSIEIESSITTGTTVSISLPVAADVVPLL